MNIGKTKYVYAGGEVVDLEFYLNILRVCLVFNQHKKTFHVTKNLQTLINIHVKKKNTIMTYFSLLFSKLPIICATHNWISGGCPQGFCRTKDQWRTASNCLVFTYAARVQLPN